MEWNNHNHEEDMEIPNYWMITYSDMVTIILCFFIVFFAFSVDETKSIFEVKEDLKSEIQKLSEEKEVLKSENENLKDKNQKLEEEKQDLAKMLFQIQDIEVDMKTSKEDFVSYLREKELLDDVYMVKKEDGLLIRFKDNIIFNSGKAELSEEGKEVLSKIGDKISSIENPIRIEGFTDNRPISTNQYPSNWELSAARAISVVKYFIEDKNISEDRMSFSGWGDMKPIADNETEYGRSQNRRIEITILNN